MKQYWPILFLVTIILFQGYVFLWHKSQTITLATHQKTYETPTPTPHQKITDCANNFYYPHASVKESTTTHTFLETNDLPFVVKSWYEDALSQSAFNIQSSIESTTNGTASEMLVGAKESQQITVTIGRGEQESTTSILIHPNFCK